MLLYHWCSVIVPLVSPLFPAADFMQWCTGGALLVIGWLIHYAPYFLLSRVLFLHHYLPALPFKFMLMAVLCDHLLTWSRLQANKRWGRGSISLLLTSPPQACSPPLVHSLRGDHYGYFRLHPLIYCLLPFYVRVPSPYTRPDTVSAVEEYMGPSHQGVMGGRGM